MNTFCCELDTFQRQFAVVHIYSSASLRKAKKSFATSLPWLKSHMLSRIHFTELKWEYFIEFPTFWQWPWAINSLISANCRRINAIKTWCLAFDCRRRFYVGQSEYAILAAMLGKLFESCHGNLGSCMKFGLFCESFSHIFSHFIN